MAGGWLNGTKFWARNNNGTLVCALLASTIDEMERFAKVWNRGEKRPGMRVDIIANAEKTAEATQVRAVY